MNENTCRRFPFEKCLKQINGISILPLVTSKFQRRFLTMMANVKHGLGLSSTL